MRAGILVVAVRYTAAPIFGRVENTEDFLEALQKADDDYMSAMDLRKQLEDAYQKRQR